MKRSGQDAGTVNCPTMGLPGQIIRCPRVCPATDNNPTTALDGQHSSVN